MSREDLWHNGPLVSITVLQQSTKTLVTSVLNERTAASPTWESSITVLFKKSRSMLRSNTIALISRRIFRECSSSRL